MEHRLFVHTNASSISLASQKRKNKKVCMSICLKMCNVGCQSRQHVEGCARRVTVAAVTALFWSFVFYLAEMTDIIICDVH